MAVGSRRRAARRYGMTKQIQKAFLMGENVYLRPLERQDLKGEYRNWVNDPEITGHMAAGTFPVNDDELVAYYESNMESSESVLFAIVEKTSGRHVGNARIYRVDWINRKAYRGIMIGDRSCWGKGYGLEVINLISKYAFKYLNLNKLVSTTLAENIGIHKVNERAGYMREGEIREEFFRDGRYHDAIYWGLLKADYNKK